ncbi:hypothetical protein D8674_035242 [Pyrus ussuriensis x Pyrus communis]|uniref:Uncharacterized protein n=1 Tax=Pyrus ussuriensis x Pyrus communis TaxID=2448454 RepID=A0A5N5GBV9_9ROSA|nr:hypothetical protein D8674_035242 [Pyrus ussuriensis x Pyrus communis]
MVICHQHKPHIQILKLLGGGELSDAFEATNLLVEDERYVECVDRGEIGGLEVADGLKVLDGYALVILGATGEDEALLGAVGGEGRVGPLVRLGVDGGEVGVEEEKRGERGGIWAR